MVLDADHLSGFVVVGLLDDGGRLLRFERLLGVERGDRGGGLVQRNRGLVAVVDLAAVLAAPQPVLQFVDGGLEGAVETVGTTLAADDGSASARGDLDVLTVLALATVAFVLELDVETVDRAIEPLEASELLRDETR